MTVTIIGPTPETEQQREVNADDRYRIHNGIDYTGDYYTLEQAIKNGIKAGAGKVAKAKLVGGQLHYSEVVYLGNNVDIRV